MSALLLAAALTLIVVVVVQVLVPRLGERKIEQQLASEGGEAFVAIDALPALRLLWKSGDRITVRGRELVIGMSKEGGGLSALDGFRIVDIVLTDFLTGPFEVTTLELSRHGEEPYVMSALARTTGAALADYGGGQMGLTGAALIGAVAKQAPLGDRSFPISVRVELVSKDGVLAVDSGAGRIGGYPAGPIATALAAAIARRLEISY